MSVVGAPRIITPASFDGPVDWAYFVTALENGHRLGPPQIEDVFLGPQGRTLLSRAAWIDGLGYGVKSVTAMSENTARGLPTVQGAMLFFDTDMGSLKAVIESSLITNIKTASDSALGARLLARPDSKTLLVVGAGSVAANIIAAYTQLFEGLSQVLIWNRNGAKAIALADRFRADGLKVEAVTDLASAVGQADIITTATMSSEPVILGDWVQPGTHVDLIGAFRPDMREADDILLQKSRIFVDSRETTIHHIGEIKIPLETGAIAITDIRSDLYELVAGDIGRISPEDITVFKNGGGAHLDLMIASAMLDLPTR
jgi:ornithine cyclodeaminase